MKEIAHSGRTADLARRRERGIEACARIFNVPAKDMPAAMTARVGPMFAEEAFLAAGGPAWSDLALNDRERSIVIVTVLAAQGVAGDRLDHHIRLAQRSGLGYEALVAMMMLATSYIGQAHGSLAMEAVQRVAGAGSPTPVTDPATPIDNEVKP